MTWDPMQKLKEIEGIRKAVQINMRVRDKALDRESGPHYQSSLIWF